MTTPETVVTIILFAALFFGTLAVIAYAGYRHGLTVAMTRSSTEVEYE
jgi:hypothetical protein